MSAKYELFQVDYPKLVTSKVIISIREGATTHLKVVLDGLNFLNSHWIFYGVNVEIINCNAASLVLELQYLKHATIQNCTFGNWTFSKVQNAFIKNCNNVFDEGFSTSLKFYNSSVFVENMTIEHDIVTRNVIGIFVYNYSLLHVVESKFVNNTVTHGIIKTLKSSRLIMSNCTVLENYATEYPRVIYAKKSFVHLENTNFNSNMAINGGGTIFIEHMSFLQIKNCTFKNNKADMTSGVGGAILSLNNSSIDLSSSLFEHNKANVGGAIYQETSKTKLNQCTFFGNSDTAIASWDNCEAYIMNSNFQNNLAEHRGGAVDLAGNSVLNVSNTTFENNAQISASTLNLYQPKANGREAGGAIVLVTSVGNISKSWFHNNSASYWCGSIIALKSILSISDTTFENNVAGLQGGAICNDNSSMNIEYSKFQNNSVLNKVFGRGGSLQLRNNCTTKISSVFFSKCHANVGGAIASNSTTIIMSNSSVTANTGSAIYLIYRDSLEINNSTFFNNSTPKQGGALLCQASSVKMVNTKFSQNKALNIGGAFHMDEMSKLTVHNCSFTYNTAQTGSAMGVTYSDLIISKSNFSHNTANEGGAVDLYRGRLVMTTCYISIWWCRSCTQLNFSDVKLSGIEQFC